MEDSRDTAAEYNQKLLKATEKLKNKNTYYSSLVGGSKVYNAITGVVYPFLSGSKYENALWKVIAADKSQVLYYDSPEEWLRHKKKMFRYDNHDLQSNENVVLWYEPSEEDIISMKANGKKKIPKYIPKINPSVKSVWEKRRQSVL